MEIDHKGAIVEVTSYMMRMATLAKADPKAKQAGSTALFKDLLAQDHDHLAVLVLASLMMQVGTIAMLAERVNLPGMDAESLVTMMAQQALQSAVS